MMFYINQATCISPQATFTDADIHTLKESTGNQLKITEPAYQGMPANVLRRMSKIMRIGVGAALPLLSGPVQPNAIIIGTANGGMEESSKFLAQIIEYDEGLLTPGDFVQSNPNATAALIGLLKNNHSYNVTHVHRGHAFENAVIDAAMLLNENPANIYLLGGMDGTSDYNYRIDELDGWYKKEAVSNFNLYGHHSPGTISGEGAAMFMVSNQAGGALARLKGIATLNSKDSGALKQFLQRFLDKHLQPGENIDLLLTGENGDSRFLNYYQTCESLVNSNTTIARFKHLCGEYPTASSFALWLACQFLGGRSAVPQHMVKTAGNGSIYKNILIYNNHKGDQHSCMLLGAV